VTYYLGLDLGQRQDFSAIAVVERRERQSSAFAPPELDSLAVRLLERVPLGTPYPEVVDRVRTIAQMQELRGHCCVAVDATGVGAPVVDLLRSAGIGCEICAVTITGGEKAQSSGSWAGVTRWSVPKQDLIAGMQVLLEKRELRIAHGLRTRGDLVRELLDMRATTVRGGRVRIGADGCGEHDDLVIAVALACWRASRARVGGGLGRLPGI
jgi:hypothetical protein